MPPTTPGQAIIRGIPERPDVTEINVRSGPGTIHALLFKAAVGASGAVLDALPDDVGKHFEGKTFQWLKLRLDDGREGWVRDDLLDLAPGDHTAVGYGVLAARTFAFALARDTSPPAEPPAQEPPLWVPADESEPAQPEEPPQPEAPEPAEQPLTPHAPPADTTCTAVVIGSRSAINVRAGPSIMHPVIMQVVRGTYLEVLETRLEETTGEYRWVRIHVQGRDGWIREDMLSFRGAGSVAAGLIPALDLFPAPMALPNYWWVRGFEGPLPAHSGWDLGAPVGEPVLAGGNGQVTIAFTATRVTPEKPSVVDHGIPLSSPAIFSDPGWGFGYGHYVVVRYLHEVLPEAAQARLAAEGLPGAAVYVMYAHLNTRQVHQGQIVTAGQMIGTCGNTGNSQGPHLHLEVRASTNPNETSWARLGSGLLPPEVLFNR